MKKSLTAIVLMLSVSSLSAQQDDQVLTEKKGKQDILMQESNIELVDAPRHNLDRKNDVGKNQETRVLLAEKSRALAYAYYNLGFQTAVAVAIFGALYLGRSSLIEIRDGTINNIPRASAQGLVNSIILSICSTDEIRQRFTVLIDMYPNLIMATSALVFFKIMPLVYTIVAINSEIGELGHKRISDEQQVQENGE